MKTAHCKLENMSPYSQSRYHSTEKNNEESPADYEKRTWREKVHADQKGEIFIPPMAFKNCLTECAKYLNRKVKGEGKSTWTKHFEAGVIVTEPVYIGLKKEDVESEWLFVPSDGRRGGSTRVEKCFPLIHSWKGDLAVHILDDKITEEIFEEFIVKAGSFIGVGRFRPRNNGFYGRFKVTSIKWE